MIIDTDTITEDEAGMLFLDFCRMFKWKGTYISTENIEMYWDDRYGDEDDYQPLTDEQIAQVMKQDIWGRRASDQFCMLGNDIVRDAVHMACRMHGWKDKA